MRGKISDQDLTDYALNELPPEERLYVESMLAISEECRADVYANLELAQMLEESFELQPAQVCPDYALTDSQRNVLVEYRAPVPLWECAAAVVGLAALTTFVLTNPAFWGMDDPALKVSQVSTQMSRLVAAAATPANINFTAPLANIAAFAEESVGWLPAATEFLEPVVCTPPSWLDYRANGAASGDVSGE